MSPEGVNVPEIVNDSSTSNAPPLMLTFAASVPALLNFNVPPVFTVMFPERILPEVIETGRRLLTSRFETVESVSISNPRLSAEEITFATLIPESFNLEFAPRLILFVFWN